MDAVVVHGAGDIRLEDIPVPTPHQGEVLLKVSYVGICGSDLSYYRYGAVGAFTVEEPLIVGHEVVGRVVTDTREGGLAPGTPVTIHPATPGRAVPGIEHRPNIWPESQYLGSAATRPHTQGAASQYTVVRGDQIRVLPDSLPLRRAALAEPLAVGIHAIARAGGVAGASVLISGAGPIGLLTLGAAIAGGARRVAIADILPEPLAIAQQIGAQQSYLIGTDQIPEESFDVVIECAGVPAALDQAVLAARRGGIIVQVGILPGEARSYTLANLITRELELRGAFRFDAELDHAVETLTNMPNLERVITAEFPPQEASAAFDVAADPRRSCKVLLTFAGEDNDE